ncbi:unnamed protein product [Vitrella brassicaformis CCMP3155]|uniref:Uncharacterized protein n=1 Tax=Vitrella brassicaformis (strain CCMP3155) TaxID=1169540 RepID=A0A0G4EZ43_VITBC|nr:unnamed protein product [Vitrella brassicaformis CCMP3155]|eukprot:CEM04370.1 unnamed protein product [Vitrella brassicaformis CCMP3155]
MQPTGAAHSSSRPASPALFQPADLFDLSLPISKMAAMAMATDDAKRAALRSQIATRTRQQELLGHTAETVNSTLLNAVQQHIHKALSRLGLADVLAFDIGGDMEAGLKVVYVLEWGTTAFHQLLLALAIYKIVGQQLIYRGTSLALRQADNGHYRIGGVGLFRVVPLGELPGGHRYADGYKRTDPVIRWGARLYPCFSAFLLHALLSWWCYGEGVGERRALRIDIGSDDPRYGRLLRTDDITEDVGIAIDGRLDRGDLNDATNATDYRCVIVSGFRPGHTVAAALWMRYGDIQLCTTEAPVGHDRSHPLADRFRESVGAARRLLRRFELESAVIDRGTVLR